mmetsp:Transcript_39380/g.77484  ORF Transcript_39380/g.77484 Transcript_39380/m.77484 type:complete len:361 (-) Transcript_39380:139-1221(-)|eukprot:CAMPEP_0175122874 /NCGR_PEP_ID=MMETSP0087-20121206/1943_1 /TAXON_ID=136419 /ORGANISM="Unknown Unknown, Strain D1" /LENGTH=360 /DNA_ID=CAMNT_0016404529 /DNA_START=33 /DNA_END=1115 /DNA_ORIENTATION=+
MIRWGILSTANIARTNVRSLSKCSNGTCHAVASRSKEKADKFAEEHKIPLAFGSYDELLDCQEIDAVYIPLPTSLHLEWVVKAACKHKHILLEKPVALTAADLVQMITACKKNKVLLVDAAMWKHGPRAQQLALAAKNSIGKVRRVRSHFNFAGTLDQAFIANDIRIKGDMDKLGCLGDLGWYTVGNTLNLLDYAVPTSVIGVPSLRHSESNNVIAAAAILKFDNGVIATMDCGFDSCLKQSICADGELGSVSVDDMVIPSSEEVVTYRITRKHDCTRGASDPFASSCFSETVTVQTPKAQQVLMFEDFNQAVHSGLTSNSDWHWIEKALTIQSVVDAIQTSCDSNSTEVPVVVPAMPTI